MDRQQNLEYAEARLALAKIVGHEEDIAEWTKHVDYWKNQEDKDLKPGDFIPLSPTFYDLMRIE